MMDWLSQFYNSLSLGKVLFGLGIFLASLAISMLLLAIVMVKIPEDYFSSSHTREFMPGHTWFVRWGIVIIKNLVGMFLLVLGILLSLPGVPGQGFLTILLGLIMLDIPGKRPLEAKIVSRPAILHAINTLRARYNKPPLILD